MKLSDVSKLDRRQKGLWAEEYVCSLLPKCININSPKEQHKPHDLEWLGIKINVKYSSLVSENGSLFFYCGSDSTSEVIYVCMTIFNGKPRFWVLSKIEGAQCCNLYHSIPSKELRMSIMDSCKYTLDNYQVVE